VLGRCLLKASKEPGCCCSCCLLTLAKLTSSPSSVVVLQHGNTTQPVRQRAVRLQHKMCLGASSIRSRCSDMNLVLGVPAVLVSLLSAGRHEVLSTHNVSTLTAERWARCKAGSKHVSAAQVCCSAGCCCSSRGACWSNTAALCC
jgi:hypothetical protein